MLIIDTSDRSFSFDTDALGSIVVYRLTVKQWFKLANQIKNPDDLSAKQIVTTLIWFAAHRKTNEFTPNYDDEGSRLNLEQFGLIGDDEWTNISERYIELHQSSFKKTEMVVEETETGEETSREVARNVIGLKRNEGEAATDYLARLVKDQLKRIAEHAHKLKDLFDQNIYKQFREASTAWSSLTDSVAQFQKQWQAKLSKVEMKPFLDIPAIDPKSFISPFPDIKKRLEEISDYQAKLTPLMIDSANLLGQMYHLSSDVAVDFKQNIRESSTYNKVIIFIAILALCATVVFSWLSFSSSREASQNSSKEFRQLIDETRQLRENLLPLKDIYSSNKEIARLLRTLERNTRKNEKAGNKQVGP